MKYVFESYKRFKKVMKKLNLNWLGVYTIKITSNIVSTVKWPSPIASNHLPLTAVEMSPPFTVNEFI
jgi:hypothetical protein